MPLLNAEASTFTEPWPLDKGICLITFPFMSVIINCALFAFAGML